MTRLQHNSYSAGTEAGRYIVQENPDYVKRLTGASPIENATDADLVEVE